MNNPFSSSAQAPSSFSETDNPFRDQFGAESGSGTTSNEIWGGFDEQHPAASAEPLPATKADWKYAEGGNPWKEATSSRADSEARNAASTSSEQQGSSVAESAASQLYATSNSQSSIDGQHGAAEASRELRGAPPLPRRPPSTQSSFAEAPNLHSSRSHISQTTGHPAISPPLPHSPRNPFSQSTTSPEPSASIFGDRSAAARAPDRDPTPSESADHIIRRAMDDLVKAHRDEIFLRQLKAPPSASAPQRVPPLDSSQQSDELDAVADSFKTAFPSLSRSPSPVSAVPLQAVGQLSSSDGFEEQVKRTTGLLVWQLQQYVEREVAKGEQGWRDEKRRGMQEVEELERELAEESEGRKKAEKELQALQRALQEATASHNLDLEAAARASAELSDRVDILQAALNETAGQAEDGRS